MMWSLYLWTILSLTLVQSAPIEDIGELSLDLLPPFENFRDSRQLTDSYGQPISFIQAESTPEGRKIAKTDDGIQFEIPTYASGIIDDRKTKEDASISTSVINNPQSQIPLNVIIPKIEPHIQNSNIEFEIVKSMEIELKDIEPKVDHKRQSGEAHGSGIRAPIGIFDEQKQLFTQYRRQEYARKLKFDAPYNDLLPPINIDIVQNSDDSESSQLLNENRSSVLSTLSSSVLPQSQTGELRTTKAPSSTTKNNEPHIKLELLPPISNDYQIDISSHLNLTNNEENSLDRKSSITSPPTELLPPAGHVEHSEPEVENLTLEIEVPVLKENAQQQQPVRNNEVAVEAPVTDLLPPYEDNSTTSSIETTTTIAVNVPTTTQHPEIKNRFNPADSEYSKKGVQQHNNAHKRLDDQATKVTAPSIDLLPPPLEITTDESNPSKETEINLQTNNHNKNTDKTIDITQNTTPLSNQNVKSFSARQDVPELILDLLPPFKDNVSVDLKLKPLPLNNEINNITNKTLKEINLSLDLLPPIKNDNNIATTNSINNKISTEKPLIPEGSKASLTTDNSLWKGDIYKGGFGGPSGFLGDQKKTGPLNKNVNADLSTTKVVPKTEDKYRGGFGGPSGILGEQKEIGTFHKKANKDLSTTEVALKTEDIYKDGFGGPSGILGEQKEIGTFHKNANKDLSTTEVTLKTEDIYKGGFGGPSGILGEQKEIGTFNKKANKDLSTTEGALKTEDIYKGGFGGPSGILGEQTQIGTLSATEVVPRTEEIYKGGFGGPSAILGEQKEIGTFDKNADQDLSAAEVVPTTEEIYKGGFGGPPGFLGEQKEIGTFEKNVNQDLSTAEVVSTTEEIYKGGFGGPSGFLGEQKEIGTFDKNVYQDLSTTEVVLTTEEIYQDGSEGPSDVLGEQTEIETYHKDLSTTEIVPETEVTSSLETTTVTIKTTTNNLKDDHYEGDIYKGRFGGPSGFLGEQKDIGTYHKANDAQISTINSSSKIIVPTTPTEIQDNPFLSNIDANTGILGEHLHSNKIQVKSKEKNIIGTTTPPTSLLSVSTTLTSTNKIINKTSTTFPASNFSPTFSDTDGAIAPPSRLFEPPFLDSSNPKSNFKINVPNNNFSEQPSTSFAERLNFDKEKSTGANDFRFPSGNPPTQTFDIQIQPNANIPFDKSPSLSPVTSQKPSPIAPANTFPQNIGQKPASQLTNKINFGGAPGILGNQKPGYAVRPDGTIKDPDHEYKGPGAATPIAKPAPVQKPVGSVSPPNNANKYNGGFGGAPGILAPFDNGK